MREHWPQPARPIIWLGRGEAPDYRCALLYAEDARHLAAGMVVPGGEHGALPDLPDGPWRVLWVMSAGPGSVQVELKRLAPIEVSFYEQVDRVRRAMRRALTAPPRRGA